MIYQFRDTTDHSEVTPNLPTEAVSINGQYIETVLDGYRTLYTKGRESLGAQLETYAVGTADGETYKYKRYPARTLTVGFQLVANNPQEFREKFTNLNNLLSLDEADFIFADEPDKFFSGIPIMDATVEAGVDSVKGEWKIYCAYPFKRSIEPVTLTMEDAEVVGNTATFAIEYNGARPARPVLRAKFAGARSGGESSEDGDCGYIAFMDGSENIIQLGNPDVLDLDQYTASRTLINRAFTSINGWSTSSSDTWRGSVTGSISVSGIADPYWNGGKGQDKSFAKPSYGSASGWHGAILHQTTEGAQNFTLQAVHRICASANNQTGIFECSARNTSTGKIVAGFIIEKTGSGMGGVVRYIIDNKVVGSDNIDLSYYNTHFGYCKRTSVYVTQTYYDPVIQYYTERVVVREPSFRRLKHTRYVTKSRTVWVARTRQVFNKYNYTQSNLNSSIVKKEGKITFKVGNLPQRNYTAPDVAQVIAHKATLYFGTAGTPLHTNAVHSFLFRRDAGVPFAEKPNVFTAGDIVEADCNDATVYLYRDGSEGGALSPMYCALGNDWESFVLKSGVNTIRATWSEWVNPDYKPEIEIEYNEVDI